MPAFGKIDQATGLQLTFAKNSRGIHLVKPGWHFTLCGRQAIYKYNAPSQGRRCATCQWEYQKQLNAAGEE